MKNVMLAVLAMEFVFAACNSNADKSKETKTEKETTPAAQMYACSMHPEVTGKKGDKCPKCGMELSEPVKKDGSSTEKPDSTSTIMVMPADFSIKEIVGNYLKLKNALTKDDSKNAAAAGTEQWCARFTWRSSTQRTDPSPAFSTKRTRRSEPFIAQLPMPS